MARDAGDITQLLSDASRRGPRGAERLLPAVYANCAPPPVRSSRHERSDHTLQATALVHEAYLRLVAGGYPTWNDRQHFPLRAAAEAMRRIISWNTRGWRRDA